MMSMTPTVNGAGSEARTDALTTSFVTAADPWPRIESSASAIVVSPSASLASSVSALVAARAKSPFGAPRASLIRLTISRPENSFVAVPAISARMASLGARPCNVTLASDLISHPVGRKPKRPCRQAPLQTPIDQPPAVGLVHRLTHAAAVAICEFQPLEPDVTAQSRCLHCTGDIRRLGENRLR